MITPYYDNDGITLYQGDCLEVMPYLIEQGIKVDATICDLPYGQTACSWDQVIPLVDMWRNIKALNRTKAATVLFGSQPFTSLLIASNIKDFKYELIWDKGRGFEPQLANIRPMKAHENIVVFCEGPTLYNPQKTMLNTPDTRNQAGMSGNKRVGNGQNILASALLDKTYNDRYPTSIQYFMPVPQAGKVHSTQKPTDLIQWLIRTYTNPGDTILDFTCGSGTTLLAAKLEGRKCIGIERDTGKDGECLGYCEYAVSRLAQSCMVFV